MKGMRCFVLAMALAVFVAGSACEALAQRKNPTKQSIKAHGQSAAQAARTRWQSLSPEQQQLMRQKSSEAVGNAKSYWNSLSPEEQQEALDKAKQRGLKARQRWESIPEE